MVDPLRLIAPEDTRLCYPGLNFTGARSSETDGEPVLLTDPTYLADVYNSEDELADAVRTQGVFVTDFGGDTSGPVWWMPPYLMLPIASHLPRDVQPPPGTTVLTDDVGTDSASFVFLPLTDDLPAILRARALSVVEAKNGAALALPAGSWTLYYEQWYVSGQFQQFRRNIVAQWDSCLQLSLFE